MNKYRNPARLLALLLALTLAFSLTALPAFAEGSGRPTLSGEVYAGFNYEGNPAVTVWEYQTENEVSLQPGGSYPDEENPLITYSWDDTNRMITAAVNADIETTSTGISADADSGSIIVTAGNITATGGESTGVFAAGDARITAGTITAGGDYSYGMRVFDGADVTADSVSDADGTGVWARGSGTTVSVRKDIEADRGIELGIQNGSEFGITVGGDVTAKSRGLYVPSEGQPYDPENPGRADVIIGGTLSGQNPIVLENEIGNDSLNLTVWRVQRTGKDGKAMPYDEQNKFIVSETFDPTIRYIIRVQQPEKGATLTVKDKEGNELKAIETASGVKIDGVGPLKEGDLLFVVATTEEGYEVTAVYGDEGKKQALEYDEDSNSWKLTVPKGGGVVISADVNLKQFTISFFNAEGDQTPLWSGSFPYGETPAYGGETTPTKAADAQFNYTWDGGWNPTLAKAVKDANYYATFTEKVNTYEVKFDTGEGGALNASGDESEGGTYDYGTDIKLPNATRDGYTLQYWTDGVNDYKAGSDFTVSGTQTLTAVWVTEIEEPRSPVEDFDDSELVWFDPNETLDGSAGEINTTSISMSIGRADNSVPSSRADDSMSIGRADDSKSISPVSTLPSSQTDDSVPISQADTSRSAGADEIAVYNGYASVDEDDDKTFLVDPVDPFGPDDWFAGADEQEIYFGGGSGADVDLASVAMATDISCDNNDDVAIYSLANTPDALKETAKQEVAALKGSGYKIDCGFVLQAMSTAACTINLSAGNVPDRAQIFVNGTAVQAELIDGYFVFDVTLPAIVLVAHT